MAALALKGGRRVVPAALAALCLLAGSLQISAGGYIWAKAQLAQWLMDRAWDGSDEGRPVKPWPWADMWPAAKLRAPRLAAETLVLAQASGQALAFGPGLVRGGPAAAGLSVIAAHRDTHFRYLKDLRPGDRLNLEWAGRPPRAYRVRESFILDVNQQSLMDTGENLLALVTCYPFDALAAGGPLRYVVIAEPIKF